MFSTLLDENEPSQGPVRTNRSPEFASHRSTDQPINDQRINRAA
jgi:hypothetical protein